MSKTIKALELAVRALVLTRSPSVEVTLLKQEALTAINEAMAEKPAPGAPDTSHLVTAMLGEGPLDRCAVDAGRREAVTLADVLDALNAFNRPKPNEDDGPWEAGHFIRVDYLPAFINIIAEAWFAAPPQPLALSDEPAPTDERLRAIADEVDAAMADTGPDRWGRRWELSFARAVLAEPRVPLPDDRIIEIANETHRAMPAGSDEQDEVIAIVRACFDAAAGRET